MISPLGDSSQAVVESIMANRHTFCFSDNFSDIAVCPVLDFSLADYIGRWKHRKYLHRGAQFALAAAVAAKNSAKLPEGWNKGAGLYLGMGPNLALEDDFGNTRNSQLDSTQLHALWLLKYLPNTAASSIAQKLDIHGPNITMSTACAASLQAIGEAFRSIKHGYCEVALAGGGDSRLSQGGLLGYMKAGALWRGKDPSQASRPFDMRRNGFVAGEGGAVVVMESLEHALKRGATIYAEICGFGASLDGHAMTAPAPDGKYAEQAVRYALHEAELQPEDIQAVSAHGTSTPLNDAVEAGMLERVFVNANISITALKSWIGHSAAACGALELAILLSCLQAGSPTLPAVRNLTEPCSDRMHFSTGDRVSIENIVFENFGFGGQNVALVVRVWNG